MVAPLFEGALFAVYSSKWTPKGQPSSKAKNSMLRDSAPGVCHEVPQSRERPRGTIALPGGGCPRSECQALKLVDVGSLFRDRVLMTLRVFTNLLPLLFFSSRACC